MFWAAVQGISSGWQLRG